MFTRTAQLDTARVGRLFAQSFVVERELTGGGMARVFVAEEKKHHRQVVLKILRPDIAAAVGPERFLREIRIVAQLSHPHILPLIDSGEIDGLLYFVTPYLTDGSLRDRLALARQLPIEESLRIAQEIASAVDYAHRHGFVHRDLKPENILFSDGHSLLADFGIARVLHTPAAQATEAGLAVGTPAYMSPEQASADSDLGPASDIYGLGCVVYEMLAGEPPFHSDNPRSILMRQVTEPPPRIRTVRPDVPTAVEESLLRALAKEPLARFATASEFVQACRREVVIARSTEASRSIAVLPFANSSADSDAEYLSDGITEELINALAKIPKLRVSSRSSVFALKGKPHDARSVGALLGVSYVLEGMVRKAGNRLRITVQLTLTESGQVLWSDGFDRELRDLFDVQDEIARTIVATLLATSLSDMDEALVTPRARNEDAYRYYLRGRYAWNKRTAEGIAEAIRWFEQAVEKDSQYASAYSGLADSYALHVDYRSVPVDEGFSRAKEYARKALSLDDSLAEAHASLAWTLFIYDWNWEEAGREYRRAIELDPRYATAHQWYSFLLISQGRSAEALVEAHTATELDPASVSVRRSLGWIYYYSRRYEEARSYLRRAVEMNPLAEETYRIIGLSWAAQGELAEAERVFRESAALPGSGSYARSMLGYVLARRGDRAGADAIRAELEERSRTEYVSPMAFTMLAFGYGDRDEIFRWLERAKADRRGWLAYIRVHPLLDPLRGDPRLDRLVADLRLQELRL